MQAPLHCYFRSHTLRRYAFRSLEKAALQEIGPRFTLKLRWLKKGIPGVKDLGAPPPPLMLASDAPEGEETKDTAKPCQSPKGDEYLWQWKVSTMFIYPALVCSHSDATAARVGGFTTNFFLMRSGFGRYHCTLCVTSGGYVIPYCLNIRQRVV